MTAIAVRLRIEGRVQGVWYRAWTMKEANARGLQGWVRNRGDGSVEALLHGPMETVRDMVEACRKGPPAARVEHIAEHPAEPPTETGFRQLPDE